MIKILERADLTFCQASTTIADEKISLNVSRRFVSPALTRTIADLFRPSTLRAATSSKVTRRR